MKENRLMQQKMIMQMSKVISAPPAGAFYLPAPHSLPHNGRALLAPTVD